MSRILDEIEKEARVGLAQALHRIAQRWAALTVAYVDGHHIELRDGRLRLDGPDDTGLGG